MRLAAFVAAGLLVFAVAGCAKKEAASSAPAAGISSDVKYDGMTDAELLELAKKETGDLNVYCITSRMQTSLNEFKKAYPELSMNFIASDFDQAEATQKIQLEAETGNTNADILQCKDNAGELFNEFYSLGFLETYLPTDIVSRIDPELTKTGMPFYAGMNFWYYNTDMFKNGPPITSWWDVVEKDASGKNKYNIIINEPTDTTTLSIFSMLILKASELEAAYKAKYGKDLEYTYDASKIAGIPARNAGYELFYRLSQSKVTYIDDGDDVVDAVAHSVIPTLGYCSAGKITNRDDNNWPIAWVDSLTPFTSTLNVNYVYLVKGSDNPAASRLFIRFLMGGTDGTGPGMQPFTKEGNWSIRSDYVNPANPFGTERSGIVTVDLNGVYDIFRDVRDFWVYWQNLSPNK
jgi:iron(III) transport system substrate-binding protein